MGLLGGMVKQETRDSQGRFQAARTGKSQIANRRRTEPTAGIQPHRVGHVAGEQGGEEHPTANWAGTDRGE